MQSPYTQQFIRARTDAELVVLEGFHAFKHALLFDAEIIVAVTLDKKALIELAQSVAPDVVGHIKNEVIEISEEIYSTLASHAPKTGVIAIAKKPPCTLLDIKNAKSFVIVLEDPRNLDNVGAVVRVAAAAGAGAVVTTGMVNPWSPPVVRAAAGLHFALPVMRVDILPKLERMVVALDPDGNQLGTEIQKEVIDLNSVLIFGTERTGVSEHLKEQADFVVRLPMRDKVSSLNLATSVAATLYMVR